MSVQALPEVPHDGFIDVPGSNQSQQRGAHGLFRFFGKLAPDVTARVLDIAVTEAGTSDGLIVDVMCGSGTTLLEANARRLPAIGIDCNPIAVLYAQAKTTPIDAEKYLVCLASVKEAFAPASDGQVEALFGRLRNYERWFSSSARRTVVGLREAIECLPDSPERRLLLAVLVSRARKVSNASDRTGRIFYDPSSAAADPLHDFINAAERALDAAPHFGHSSQVFLGDARAVPMQAESARIVFCHPPYFALYRYSSDVLRFELALGGVDPRSFASQEVREGWKSGDPSNLDRHAEDMGQVFSEGRRLVMRDGVFVLVTSNSTLGDHQLPVVDRLVGKASREGLALTRHYVRRARNGSASYHRSARTDKVINQDHVLVFKAD